MNMLKSDRNQFKLIESYRFGVERGFIYVTETKQKKRDYFVLN